MVPLRFLAVLFLLLAAPFSLRAKDYQWVVSGLGDGSSFSDPGNWYDLTPDVDPHNPSGPPGASDSADLGSSAAVTVGNANLGKLFGSGTSALSIGGILNVNFVNTALRLGGGGKLVATTVETAPEVVGGTLEIATFTGRGLAARDGGKITVANELLAAPNDTINVFVGVDSRLTVNGPAADVTGTVEAGGFAQFKVLANTRTSKPTLSVTGAHSQIATEDVVIHDGSLDAANGALLFIDGQLTLEGAKTGRQVSTGNSRWIGTDTTAQISRALLVGAGPGDYTVEVSTGARAIVNGPLILGVAKDSGGRVDVAETGASLLATGGLEVGFGGNGALAFADGATGSTSGPLPLRVGIHKGSLGVLDITGTDSLLTVSDQAVIVGAEAGSTGRVTIDAGQLKVVDPAGSVFESRAFAIGSAGKGELTVRNGGTLDLPGVFSEVQIGVAPGSQGSLNVQDPASIAHATTLVVGLLGKGQMNVTDFAAVGAEKTIIGPVKGGQGTVNLTGDATWDDTELTQIGVPAGGSSGVAALNVRLGGHYRSHFIFEVGPTGVVTVAAPGRIAIGPGTTAVEGAIRVANFGRLRGKGRIRAPILVADSGIVEPGGPGAAGTLTVEGAYTQQAGSELDIELGGPGTKSDLLKITGAATLGGKLKVSLTGGFDPKAGQKFKVLTAATVTGQFAETEGATVEYTPTGIVVSPIITPGTLTVTIDPTNPAPGGSVTAGFLGTTPRNVGFTYTISAKPAKGFVFNGWTGSLTSTDPNLAFLMVPDMTLQANFVPDPFAASILGSYAGLGTPSLPAPQATAPLTVTLNKGGSFSAAFVLGGKSYAFHGIFTGSGDYERLLTLGGKQFAIDLQAALDNSGTVTGTVTVDGIDYAVTSRRNTFSKKTPTDRAGTYTLLLPPEAGSGAPGGNGWATVSIQPAGSVKVAGQLADGGTFSAGGTLAANGTFPLYVSLYKGRGVLGGTLAFAIDPSPAVSDVTGTLAWTKPDEPANPVFPQRFRTSIEVLGSFYPPPAANERVLPGLNTAGNAKLTFSGGSLGSDVTKAIVISPKNALTYPAPASPADKLKLSFTAKTGAFTGSFLHPGTGKAKAFTGVVLRKQQRGAGYFLDATDSGRVELGAP